MANLSICLHSTGHAIASVSQHNSIVKMNVNIPSTNLRLPFTPLNPASDVDFSSVYPSKQPVAVQIRCQMYCLTNP